MLVPVVWFEESALIPEESARKFKSLYTDRIRLINIVLTSLFLAALGLLALDLRLLAGKHSLCFKLKISCTKAAAAAATAGQQGAAKSTAARMEPSSQTARAKRNSLQSAEAGRTRLSLPLLSGRPAAAAAARGQEEPAAEFAAEPKETGANSAQLAAQQAPPSGPATKS